MASGYGFHWGASSYWSQSLAKAEAHRVSIFSHSVDNFLPVPSQVAEFDSDYYEGMIIID